jgi:hypothetical protein
MLEISSRLNSANCCSMASGWREHGGIYQGTRHALGPFAGLVRAWNFFVRALLTVPVPAF